MFSLFLSFIVDLYIFIELTVNANIHGIAIIFCNNIELIANIIPFPFSNTAIIADIEYPIHIPLYPKQPYTNGIPIIVDPEIQIITANFRLDIIEFINNFFVSIWYSLFFIVCINSFM